MASGRDGAGVKGKARRTGKRDVVRDMVAELSGKLISLRRSRGYKTATAAAEAIGMSHNVYGAVERGSRPYNIKTIAKILRGFDATFEELAAQPHGFPNPRGWRPACGIDGTEDGTT